MLSVLWSIRSRSPGATPVQRERSDSRIFIASMMQSRERQQALR
jgi:hypothetical protein